MMKLFLVDFDSAMNLEDHDVNYIIKSVRKPTVKEADVLLTNKLYTGAVYINSISEIDGRQFKELKTKTFEVDL